MNITFYFDPSCPFSWITSRWLVRVSTQREMTITWRPFSLCLKNNELIPQPHENQYADIHRRSHRAIRVLYAAEQTGAPMGQLYTAFGAAYHLEKTDFDNQLIATILKQHSLSPDLQKSADDSSIDQHLAAIINEATSSTGPDVGVPIIIFTASNGRRQGYFGPVLQTLPELEESLALWDGLSQMATLDSFFELKRSRPQAQPDIASTR